MAEAQLLGFGAASSIAAERPQQRGQGACGVHGEAVAVEAHRAQHPILGGKTKEIQ